MREKEGERERVREKEEERERVREKEEERSTRKSRKRLTIIISMTHTYS